MRLPAIPLIGFMISLYLFGIGSGYVACDSCQCEKLPCDRAEPAAGIKRNECPCPLTALQTFQNSPHFFVVRYSYRPRILLSRPVRNVFNAAADDVVGCQSRKVAVSASDKALEHEHIPVRGKSRVIRQIHFIDGVPFLYCQKVRRSIDLCRNPVAVERAVGCRSLLQCPVENRAYPARQSVNVVAVPHPLGEIFFAAVIELWVEYHIAVFIGDVFLRTVQIVGGHRADVHPVILPLADLLPVHLQTFYKGDDKLVYSLLLPPGQSHAHALSASHPIGVGRVAKEQKLFQPMSVRARFQHSLIVASTHADEVVNRLTRSHVAWMLSRSLPDMPLSRLSPAWKRRGWCGSISEVRSSRRTRTCRWACNKVWPARG